jgi:hypothetical protein
MASAGGARAPSRGCFANVRSAHTSERGGMSDVALMQDQAAGRT